MDRLMDGWMDRLIDGWMDRLMDGGMDRQMDRQTDILRELTGQTPQLRAVHPHTVHPPLD